MTSGQAVSFPDHLAAHRIEEPADVARCAVLSIDEEGRWWERFLGTFPKILLSFGRVVAIDHIRGLINAAVSGLGVLIAPSETRLARHRLLTKYLEELNPSEFGA